MVTPDAAAFWCSKCNFFKSVILYHLDSYFPAYRGIRMVLGPSVGGLGLG